VKHYVVSLANGTDWPVWAPDPLSARQAAIRLAVREGLDRNYVTNCTVGRA